MEEETKEKNKKKQGGSAGGAKTASFWPVQNDVVLLSDRFGFNRRGRQVVHSRGKRHVVSS